MIALGFDLSELKYWMNGPKVTHNDIILHRKHENVMLLLLLA